MLKLFTNLAAAPPLLEKEMNFLLFGGVCVMYTHCSMIAPKC